MRSCPGRSIWTGRRDATPRELAGPELPGRVFNVAAAPDPVHVIVLGDGGLISYEKADGHFVHTLNTPEGFARKLARLGIRLDEG